MCGRVCEAKSIPVWPQGGRERGPGRASDDCPGLESECAERVKQPVRVLEVHVVSGRPGLSVSALEEEDLLGDTRGDGGGESALASGNAREASGVRAAGAKGAAQCVSEHGGREWLI